MTLPDALLISQILQWLVLGVLVVITLALARQIGLLNRRLPPPPARPMNQGPQINGLAPVVSTTDVIGGGEVRIPVGDGRRTLLVFITPRCQVCESLLPSVLTVARSERRSIQTILVSMTSEKTTAAYVQKHGIDIPVVASEDVGELFDVSATPYALLIDEGGVLRSSALVNHLEHLESVIDTKWGKAALDAEPADWEEAGV